MSQAREADIVAYFDWVRLDGEPASPLDSAQYALEYNEVKAIGQINSATLTPDRQTARGDKLASRIEDFDGSDHRPTTIPMLLRRLF